ncbi:MAG: peptidoglycan DD-metalloendopeptidase family protein [Flavobacteriales bacterium]|nr:peptidoglycan DD-metalloendopeptidase family protein [Flavobacteriales bacterium]MCB9204903.1 peptidoglycan DD-metalloendopeptidase family protein [Flavobacteriales bacterium]
MKGFVKWMVFGTVLVWAACNSTPEQTDNSEPEEEVEVSDQYGFVTDSFLVVKDKVRKNQNLSSILLPYGVPYATIDALARASKEVFDVRKLAAGKPYTIYCTKDSTGLATCFVYEPNAVDYVVFNMQDSVHIYKGKKDIEKKTRYVKGVVNSSLYVDLKKLDADPLLAIELSEIYAWTIDFYRIQKGDEFEVLYTENYVDGKSIGVDRILASTFTNYGKAIKAYYFESENEKGYFDAEGGNLKKAFLKAPVKYSRISSGYSMKRFHPVQKRYKAHLGTDYAAPKGTPIMAVGDGVITEARYKANNGNYVKMKHNSVYSTQYLHMSKIASGIKPGVRVSQGDVIGYVGSTGLATGPHVCFRFWKNGKQVDHRREELPPSEPISESSLAQFNSTKQRLDSLILSYRKPL